MSAGQNGGSISETRLLHGSRRGGDALGVVPCPHAVAKSGACHRAANSFGSAGAIAVARAGGQIERPCLRDVDRLARICLRGNSIRVAEAAGLNLGRRACDGRSLGASLREDIYSHRRLGNGRLHIDRNHVGFFDRNAHRGNGHIFHPHRRPRLRSWQAQRVSGWIKMRYQCGLR